MKNLKKLAIISAMLGATCSLKAFEKSFKPVEKGDAEAQGIEMIAGQLMVKSNGQMNGVDMPYTFVGTNTTNFASSGFAIKEMADANSVLLDKDNNDVYFTRASTNGVYKLKVSEKEALNGVSGQLKFFETEEPVSLLTIKDGVAYTKNKQGKIVDVGGETATIPSVTLPASATNSNMYSVSPEGYTYVLEHPENSWWWNPVKYTKDGEHVANMAGWSSLGLNPEIKGMVAFDDNNIFVLKEDGKLLYNNSTVSTQNSGIKRTQDGKGLLITSNDGKVSLYNPQTQENTEIKAAKASFASQSVEKDVTKNGLRYFVNKKLIGYNN